MLHRSGLGNTRTSREQARVPVRLSHTLHKKEVYSGSCTFFYSLYINRFYLLIFRDTQIFLLLYPSGEECTASNAGPLTFASLSLPLLLLIPDLFPLPHLKTLNPRFAQCITYQYMINGTPTSSGVMPLRYHPKP